MRRASLGAAVLCASALLVGGCGATAHTAAKPPARVVHRARLAARPPAPLPAARVPLLRLPAALPSRTLRVPILMYHRIDVLRPTLPAITRRLTVDPRDFAAQMAWLRAHGFHAVSQLQLFRALEQGAPLPAKPVAITFDDGYRDVLGKASPVLERLHMPAVAYVITDRISGGDSSFLTWGMLRTLERRGVAIGSHTVHHLELTGLSDTAALTELRDSRAVLERRLGHPVQWFSYPAGAHDARTVGLVREAGYVLAVTTQPGSLQSGSDPLELHRYEVLDSTGVAGLAALLGD